MAYVKSFRIHPEYGIPDKDIREFLNTCEKDGIMRVNTTYIPGINGKNKTVDPRITVIVTKLDDHGQEIHGELEVLVGDHP